VDSEQLAGEFRQRLLSFRSKNPRIQQLHKDLQQGRNRAPETICAILVDAWNDSKPLSEVVSPAKTITDFFSSHVGRIRRKLRELSPIETREEGDVNCIQVAIDQGDHSRPTLEKFVKEVDENIAVLVEMRDAAIAEIHAPVAQS
jgi:hypothetical protein